MSTQYLRYCTKCNTPAYEKSDKYCQNCGAVLDSNLEKYLKPKFVNNIRNFLYYSFNGFCSFFILNMPINISSLFILVTIFPLIILSGNLYIFNLQIKNDIRVPLSIVYNIVFIFITLLIIFLTKITSNIFGLFIIILFIPLLLILGNLLLFQKEPLKLENSSEIQKGAN